VVGADLRSPDLLNDVDVAKPNAQISRAFALGVQKCLNRCGIKYNSTGTSVDVCVPWNSTVTVILFLKST
jgi:hypothetical protein